MVIWTVVAGVAIRTSTVPGGGGSSGSVPRVSDGRLPFRIFNRTGNVFVRLLLRSPLHGLASRWLALITVTGRRSGRKYAIPVGYRRDGDRVRIGVQWPENKVWWRNLRDGAPVDLRIGREERTGFATVEGDEHSGVSVHVQLDTP